MHIPMALPAHATTPPPPSPKLPQAAAATVAAVAPARTAATAACRNPMAAAWSAAKRNCIWIQICNWIWRWQGVEVWSRRSGRPGRGGEAGVRRRGGRGGTTRSHEAGATKCLVCQRHARRGSIKEHRCCRESQGPASFPPVLPALSFFAGRSMRSSLASPGAVRPLPYSKSQTPRIEPQEHLHPAVITPPSPRATYPPVTSSKHKHPGWGRCSCSLPVGTAAM